MDEHLHIQSHWVSVLQALVFITIENDYEYSQKDVETVLRKRGSFMNLMATNRSGDMALHLVKSAEQVKQLIEVSEQQLNENVR